MLIDTDAGHVTWHRVEYDIAATQAAMLAAGLPPRLARGSASGDERRSADDSRAARAARDRAERPPTADSEWPGRGHAGRSDGPQVRHRGRGRSC
jgi:hypothetical protein